MKLCSGDLAVVKDPFHREFYQNLSYENEWFMIISLKRRQYLTLIAWLVLFEERKSFYFLKIKVKKKSTWVLVMKKVFFKELLIPDLILIHLHVIQRVEDVVF